MAIKIGITDLMDCDEVCSGCAKNLECGELVISVASDTLYGDPLYICRDCMLEHSDAVEEAGK